ncbi:hypothetical protein BVX93_00190, partial [bacterium B13(2017)]
MIRPLYGLIPAAGKGTRAHPYTHMIPKCMLDINGIPNLQRNICIMRDDLQIKDIIIIIGHLGNIITEYFGNGEKFDVNITYVENKALDKGLAYSILLGKKFIDGYCCVMLSDECYIYSNHKEILNVPYEDSLITCAVMEVDDRELIKRNYSVELNDNQITKLIEKPKAISNDILGSGTFIFNPKVFEYLEQAFIDANWVYVEFITFLD